MNNLGDRFDQLFTLTDDEKQKDWLNFFVQQLYQRSIESEKAVVRRFFFLSLGLLILIAAKNNALTHFMLLGLKMEKLDVLFIAAPSIIGILGYRLVSATASHITLEAALEHALCRALPNIKDLDLVSLLGSITILGSDNLLTKNQGRKARRFGEAFHTMIVAAIVITPCFSLLYAGYVAIPRDNSHLIPYFTIASSIVGLFFLIAGYLLLFRVVSYRLDEGEILH